MEPLADSSRQKLGAYLQLPLNSLPPLIAKCLAFVVVFAVTPRTRRRHAQANPAGLSFQCDMMVHTIINHKVHQVIELGRCQEHSGAMSLGE
jgi:hypothetical protein